MGLLLRQISCNICCTLGPSFAACIWLILQKLPILWAAEMHLCLIRLQHLIAYRWLGVFLRPRRGDELHPSIHPSYAASPGVGSQGQQLEQRNPDVPVPGHFLQLFRGDPEAFPGQLREIVSPTCPGSSPGSPPSGTYLEHLTREASRGHPNQMPEPPYLTPLNGEEQRLYSEPHPED